MEMSDVGPLSDGDKNITRVDTSYTDDTVRAESSRDAQSRTEDELETTAIHPEDTVQYRVYKIRWFGLAQLVLLNIVVSWDVSSKYYPLHPARREILLTLYPPQTQWLTYAPVANSAADFFSTSPSIINWLSTSFLFAFVAAAPLTVYTLHFGGPRLAIITCSVLILIGNWIRYGGTRTATPSFGLVMFGQILIGFAQPFVLAAPTRYSDLWFSPRGRVSATAIASLANPFGGAVGQLVGPFLATDPSQVPNMTLYVAIISTVAAIPSLFIPAKPRTPVSASSIHAAPSLPQTVRLLSRNPTFLLVFLPFSVYVGFFNSSQFPSSFFDF